MILFVIQLAETCNSRRRCEENKYASFGGQHCMSRIRRRAVARKQSATQLCVRVGSAQERFPRSLPLASTSIYSFCSILFNNLLLRCYEMCGKIIYISTTAGPVVVVLVSLALLSPSSVRHQMEILVQKCLNTEHTRTLAHTDSHTFASHKYYNEVFVLVSRSMASRVAAVAIVKSTISSNKSPTCC